MSSEDSSATRTYTRVNTPSRTHKSLQSYHCVRKFINFPNLLIWHCLCCGNCVKNDNRLHLVKYFLNHRTTHNFKCSLINSGFTKKQSDYHYYRYIFSGCYSKIFIEFLIMDIWMLTESSGMTGKSDATEIYFTISRIINKNKTCNACCKLWMKMYHSDC